MKYSYSKSATQECSKCKVEKPLALFSKDCSKKNGHMTICKECKLAYNQEYKEANSFEEWNRQRKWRIAHPTYHRDYYLTRLQGV